MIRAVKLLFGLVVAALGAGASPAAAAPGRPEFIPSGKGDLLATFDTSAGPIVVRLFETKAPLTVDNFVGLATGKKTWTHPKTKAEMKGVPLYDGLTFHRVIPGFMIQGGDPLSHPQNGEPRQAGRGGPGFQFEDETGNGLVFDRPFLLAMANRGPNTNGSQFFITEGTPDHLNGRHTIFGEVVKGSELVAQIAAAGNRATTIQKVTITRERRRKSR